MHAQHYKKPASAGLTKMTVATASVNRSRAKVISAARHLFSSRGFHQTAMSDLADDAQISVGTIYRLFKSKADLIEAIVDEDAEKRLRACAALSLQAKLGHIDLEDALTEFALSQISSHNEALSFEILAEAHRNEQVARVIGRLCGQYRGLVSDLVRLAHPDIEAAEAEAAEELLLAWTFGLGHRSLSNPKQSPDIAARSTAKLIVRALSRKPANDERPKSQF
jgi:TetR/AcrR family transcriptional repressor of uid operon